MNPCGVVTTPRDLDRRQQLQSQRRDTPSEVAQHSSGRVTFEKDSVAGQAGGRAFQAEGMASAKTLRQDPASCVGGTVWRPVWRD